MQLRLLLQFDRRQLIIVSKLFLFTAGFWCWFAKPKTAIRLP